MNNEQAIPVIRALADGVNPLTGEAFPDESPYAEARTLRALYCALRALESQNNPTAEAINEAIDALAEATTGVVRSAEDLSEAVAQLRRAI